MVKATANRIQYWPFDDGPGDSTSEVITGTEHRIEYVHSNSVDKPDKSPRWCDGVVQSGLLFDGYSTSIAAPAIVQDNRDTMTIESWVAPRTFGSRSTFEEMEEDRLSPIISQFDPETHCGLVFGLFRHGKLGCKIGTGTETVAVWTPEQTIESYAWSHVAVTIDGQAGSLTLYVDGEPAATTQHESPISVEPADIDCCIGKHPKEYDPSSPFDPDMFDGVLDELTIYDGVLDDEAIQASYDEVVTENGGSIPGIEYEDIALDPSVYEGDRYRPTYHLTPPGHWMNEPHAPFYYDGQYHLFYQFNPRGPYWHHIHWGHWVSDDLVHWRHLPIALTPEADGLDPDGCWTGSATYDESGTPTLFFTAGDMSKSPNQAVATAKPESLNDPDLVDWEKADELAIEQPQGIGLRTSEFRDPFVWKGDEKWYCLVSSGIEGEGGTALLYSSRTFEEWQFRGHLYRSDYEKYPELGQVWELPQLLPIGTDEAGNEKHVFIISPVGAGANVEVYYWVGEWDPESYSFTPDHEEPRLIDYGDFHFTGPSGFVDPQTGRSILFTITQDNRTQQDHYDAGWAHHGGLPLSLYLDDDGDLGIEPIDELTSLRSDQLVSTENKQVSEVDRNNIQIDSDTIEIKLQIEPRGAERVGLKLKQDPEGPEETLIYHDSSDETLNLHREHSMDSLAERKAATNRSSLVHTGDLSIEDGVLDIRVFIDKSVVECYANSKQSITTNVYSKSKQSKGIEPWADGEAVVHSLSVWDLDSVW